MTRLSQNSGQNVLYGDSLSLTAMEQTDLWHCLPEEGHKGVVWSMLMFLSSIADTSFVVSGPSDDVILLLTPVHHMKETAALTSWAHGHLMRGAKTGKKWLCYAV